VGDFNGDGKPDVVVGDYNGSSVNVLLGNGDGSFQTAKNTVLAGNTISIAVGDFNGDGKSDLAVIASSDYVSVLLGNGDGTFQMAVNYGVGFFAVSVAVADFNGDGKPDLVAANQLGDNVSVLLGNGDGSFQTALNSASGSNPGSFAVGDFNGDGKPDLAVVDLYDLTVLLGNGDGTFQAPVQYSGVSSYDGPVSVADFNGDGRQDLAVGGSILLGNGDGTFQAATMTGVGSLVVTDLNGDGKPDLITGSIGVSFGNGDGTFRSPVSCAVVKNTTSIGVGDFNGDGRTDLAVVDGGSFVNDPSSGVIVLLGVSSANSLTTLALVPSSAVEFGQPLSLSATVLDVQAFAPPTGTVNILDGTAVISSATLANDTATFTTASLASGPHTLSAAYLGDTTAFPSTSSAVPITVTGGPLWSINKTHSANLKQGQTGATYSITATNTGAVPASGTVTVTEAAPSGLTIMSMSGSGWTCSPPICTRSDGLVQGSSYPPITVTVNVAVAAQTPQVNVATVSGGGAVPASANDSAVVSLFPPFGYIDTPVNNTTGIAGAVGVTGWALSGVGVETVAIWREPVTNENPNSLIFIGTAEIIVGSRPDVAMTYPGYPGNTSGWGYQILTNELPNSNGQAGTGNGTYHLHALVTDNANTVADIGTTTITVNNAGSALPFGTIDTPTQGGTVSGTIVNFGWVLTPQPNIIPIDGSTIRVFIDNLPVGHPVYNNYRTDIATLFPDYQNSQGAVGYYYLDTTQLTNGLHTISWVARDSAGNAQGLGSRYFKVQN
jgi:hypothetical protein